MNRLTSALLTYAILIVCCSCQLNRADIAVEERELESLYDRVTTEDNLPMVGDPRVDWIRYEGVKPQIYRFFEVFEQYRKKVGARRSQEWLLGLVRAQGLNVVLTHPVSRFYVDSPTMKRLLESTQASSKRFEYQNGSPPSFERVQANRSAYEIGTTPSIPR